MKQLSSQHIPVADPAAGWGRGKKHEIYAATFGSNLLMTYFYRSKGAMAPLSPLDPLLHLIA